MWDIAPPLIVGQSSHRNIFRGQFFFDDETAGFELVPLTGQAVWLRRTGIHSRAWSVQRLSRETVTQG